MSRTAVKTGTSPYRKNTSEIHTSGSLGKDKYQSDLPAHDAVYNNSWLPSFQSNLLPVPSGCHEQLHSPYETITCQNPGHPNHNGWVGMRT
jgi:hypothetical protein